MMADAVFFLFATIAAFSAMMVIGARNPVVAVLFLILAFFNIAALFLMLSAEFLAMVLIIVYVGAVAVLFLFVIMMLNIDFTLLRRRFLQYFPIALLAGGILLVELMVAFSQWPDFSASAFSLPGYDNNTLAIGRVLYTDYFYPFQIVGLILLTAMIGAIVLALREEKDARRQDSAAQSAIDSKERITLVDADLHAGVSE